MQEIKKRFRRIHGAAYEDQRPVSRPQPVAQPNKFDLPRLENNLDDIQGVAPLPIDLGSDLSHVLPCLLKVPMFIIQNITVKALSMTTHQSRLTTLFSYYLGFVSGTKIGCLDMSVGYPFL